MDLTTIGSALGIIGFVYAFLRNFKNDMKKEFKKIDQRFEKVESELKLINSRLSSLEGAFFERGQWEGRIYSMQKSMNKEEK